MHDYTVVSFPGFGWHINVPSVFAEFTIPFLDKVVTIRWYGVIIAFGFLLAVLFGGRMAYKWKMSIDKMLDVLIFGTFGGILGARLFYVAFEWEYYSSHLSEIFKIWEGGLAIYGGLIGGVLMAMLVCHFNKLNFLNLMDIGAMSFLIGQGIGRWGNFFNQEAFGGNTAMPWGMTSAKVQNYIILHQQQFAANGFTVDPDIPVHPTFFYESVWCLLGVGVLYYICKKHRKFSGQIILTYGVWYGLERMVVEGLRTDSLYISGTTLRVSQVISAVLVVVCAVALVILLHRAKLHPKPIEGIDYFPDAEEQARKKEEKAAAKQKKAEKAAREAEKCAREVEKAAEAAEKTAEAAAEKADALAEAAEKKAQEAEKKARKAEKRTREAEKRAREAEKAAEAARADSEGKKEEE